MSADQERGQRGQGGLTAKAMSVRLPPALAGELATLARIEDVTPSELVRAAIQHFITARRTDPDLKERLRKRLEEDAEILKRFAE